MVMLVHDNTLMKCVQHTSTYRPAHSLKSVYNTDVTVRMLDTAYYNYDPCPAQLWNIWHRPNGQGIPPVQNNLGIDVEQASWLYRRPCLLIPFFFPLIVDRCDQ